MKLFNRDPRGRMQWMDWCDNPMVSGCDATITHLQEIGTGPSPSPSPSDLTVV